MSDEIERRLRATGEGLPGPSDAETLAARNRVLAAVPSSRRSRRRPLVLALTLVVAVGGAFGVGYAVASGSGSVTRTRVVHVKQRLDAGPGFLPASAWNTSTSGSGSPELTAVASNVEPSAASLGRNGVRIEASFSAASTRPGVPQRLLPLRLDDAAPANGSTRRLQARVAGYAVDVTIRFGTATPPAAVVAAAREELGRLVVPACPAALPLAAGDTDSAKAYVLVWLPAHYPGKAGDVVGATATAAAGARAPRHGEAAADCGTAVAARSVEVDVVLPALAKVSASLSELTFFVAKKQNGWVVWERAR